MKRFSKKEIFSIPNLMGYFRILLIPVFCYLYITAETEREYLYAALVVLLSSLTDLFDGKIARRFHMVTELGKASERSGSFDYNTGSISVSVSGKPWGCIWNPAESADCICSWSIVDFFCGRLHLRENSAEKKICSVKSMCDPSGIRRHRKSDRSSGKELRSGFLLFQPD